MKISILLLTLIKFSSQSIQIIENDEKLLNYVCELTKSLISEKSESQDVVLWNFNSQLPESTISDITKCVIDINPVIIADMKIMPHETTIKKSGIIIILSDEVNHTKFLAHIDTQIKAQLFNHMDKFLIVSSSKVITKQHFVLLQTFGSWGMFNVALITEDRNNVYTITVEKAGTKIKRFKNELDTGKIFPDKLADLSGYPYRIAVHNQTPRVFLTNQTVYSPLNEFIVTVAKKQNAQFKFIFTLNTKQLFEDYWMQRQMDLTLNTGLIVDSIHPKLLTYDETSFCAMIPRSQKLSMFNLIYTMPFDGLTWLFLFITFACCVLTWRLYRNYGAVDSHWTLAFGIYAFFIGQGVEFRRSNRLILVILLQLIVLMIFVLSNGYQGVITSYMIEPMHEQRINTVEELFKADYIFFVSEHFDDAFKDHEEYSKIRPKVNTSSNFMHNVDYHQLANDNFVIIGQCNQIEFALKESSELYYLLPQRMLTYYDRLEASYFNPFIERLQLIMDWSFEGGLPQAWKTFTKIFNPKLSSENYEVEIIKLKDLKQVFAILLIGYLLAIFVFLLEIFTHDFLMQFEWRFLKLNFAKLRRKKLNVRRIIVRPVNDAESTEI